MKKIALILISTAITSFSAQNNKSLVNITSKEAQLLSQTISLVDFLPKTGALKTEAVKVSNLKDTLIIKNASEIFAAEYYQNNKKVSAVLATKTEGSIYDHSKVIIDRLNNTTLEDIRFIEIRNHKIISSKIKRANGELKYSLSFSIKENTLENELFSFWSIDQYPKGNYQNFQIWGNSYLQVVSIANFIIDKHTMLKGLKCVKKENTLPNVFVKSGSYENGLLKLNIINKTKESSVIFDGNLAATEVSKHKNMSYKFALSGNYNEVIYIETGAIFDIGFSLKTNNSIQKDVLYLADGPWGLDYLNEYATINSFKINAVEKGNSDEAYEVERNTSAIGEVKGNVNLFRHLLPGNKTLDAKNYNILNFKSKNNKPIELVIMQADERSWENRLRYTIPATSELRTFNIPFYKFKDAYGNSAEISNIKTIVFSVIGDYTNFVPFNLEVNNLSFTSETVLNTKNYISNLDIKLYNYPNPFSSSTTIKLASRSSFINLQVYDSLGRVVDAKKIDTDYTHLKAIYRAPNLRNGVYKYLLKDEKGKTFSGNFLIN